MFWKNKKTKNNIAIVAAAGNSTRMGKCESKQFLMLRNKPIIAHSLLKLESSIIDKIIIVGRSGDIPMLNDVVKEFNITKVTNIITGGKTRKESIQNAINQINDCEKVLIHDGARPFLNNDDIENVWCAAKYYTSTLGIRINDTIKESKDSDEYELVNKTNLGNKFVQIVENTIERKKYWSIQTPQVFDFDVIKLAHERYVDENDAPDDCTLVEKLGMNVVIVNGNFFNIKITYPEDLILAEKIYSLIG